MTSRRGEAYFEIEAIPWGSPIGYTKFMAGELVHDEPMLGMALAVAVYDLTRKMEGDGFIPVMADWSCALID